MFLKDLKDLNNFKEDVIYVWKKDKKFGFIVYDNNEWIISYMDNYVYLMNIIINSKGHVLKADGVMFEKMKNEGLSDKQALYSLMEVLEYHFKDVSFVQEDKALLAV